MANRSGVYLGCGILALVLVAVGQITAQSSGDQAKKTEEKPPMVEWGPETSGVRLAVALPSKGEKLYAGEPVHVLFLTKNGGDKPVSVIAERGLLYIFIVKVEGPDGKPAPLTSYGRQQMDSSRMGSQAIGKLAPGAELKSGEILLSRIFDMTRRGEYKVSFSRSIWTADDARVVVTSNALTVTVAGEKAEYVPN